MLDVLHREGEERASAGSIRNLLQGLVAPKNQAAVVGRNRVDDYFGALRRLYRQRPADLALIILTVADHDDGPPHWMVAAVLTQFFAAGSINGVIHRGAAAVAQTSHPGFEQPNVVGELLRHQAVSAEAHDKGFVEIC